MPYNNVLSVFPLSVTKCQGPNRWAALSSIWHGQFSL